METTLDERINVQLREQMEIRLKNLREARDIIYIASTSLSHSVKGLRILIRINRKLERQQDSIERQLIKLITGRSVVY